MFNDLVNLYCSYCDFADYYYWAYRGEDRKAKILMYQKLAAQVEEMLREMCEEV